MSGSDFSAFSMLELFRMEAESQTQALTTDLLALERSPRAPELLESCMRAAHSLKGAARIVGLNPAVSVTHAMEDCLVLAQSAKFVLGKRQIDLLLGGVDLITKLANVSEAQAAAFGEQNPPDVTAFVSALAAALAELQGQSAAPFAVEEAPSLDAPPELLPAPVESSERSLRVSAQSFNRLLGLSAQSRVESRWLGPFWASLLRLKRRQNEVAKTLDALRDAFAIRGTDESIQATLTEARRQLSGCQAALGDRLEELDLYDRRVSGVAHRMYEEALTCRMRPLSDRITAFPRMVRDLAQSLGKRARLEIVGESTPVDRDVLDKLEAPLNHLLRNAVDHGVDSPKARAAAGKPEEGVVRLEARHLAGMLQVSVSDDGHGIDIDRVRRVIVERALLDEQTAQRLSHAELYEFLFLPGFTVRQAVTEISGRGVGLDAVQTAVKQLGGTVRVSSEAGRGTLFELSLPLTVSVVRTLIAEIAGEPYAFPLAHVERALTLQREDVKTLEGRQHFQAGQRQVGLVTAHQILGGGEAKPIGDRLAVIVLGDQESSYGLIVDRFAGVRELVVQPLEPRLGKIKDISAGALLPDGSPVLIVDVDDLLRSIEKQVATGDLSRVQYTASGARDQKKKRVLVVDDSFTVRELERKLIDGGGYEVEVAVDGVDGWNAVRAGGFDLVVTDVDMPRMDGIELVKLIKQDSRLKTLPVMIVSYKDREEDRKRGLEAGADFYLAKGSFRNEGLLEAVVDLIGEPRA